MVDRERGRRLVNRFLSDLPLRFAKPRELLSVSSAMTAKWRVPSTTDKHSRKLVNPVFDALQRLHDARSSLP
jgi:hypothetical protein